MIFQFYLMYRLICQKPVHFLSAQMALVSTFFQIFIVLGMYNFERKPLRSCRLREVTEHDTNHSSYSSYSNLRLQSGSSTSPGGCGLRLRAVDQKKSYIAWTPRAQWDFLPKIFSLHY